MARTSAVSTGNLGTFAGSSVVEGLITVDTPRLGGGLVGIIGGELLLPGFNCDQRLDSRAAILSSWLTWSLNLAVRLPGRGH